jgi:ethanolamine utilization protein EutP
MNALFATAVDADLILFVIDPKQEVLRFAPSQALSYPCPVIGVVTKTDIASEKEVASARTLLKYAGVSEIFCVSAVTGSNMERLMDCFIE